MYRRMNQLGRTSPSHASSVKPCYRLRFSIPAPDALQVASDAAPAPLALSGLGSRGGGSRLAGGGGRNSGGLGGDRSREGGAGGGSRGRSGRGGRSGGRSRRGAGCGTRAGGGGRGVTGGAGRLAVGALRAGSLLAAAGVDGRARSDVLGHGLVDVDLNARVGRLVRARDGDSLGGGGSVSGNGDLVAGHVELSATLGPGRVQGDGLSSQEVVAGGEVLGDRDVHLATCSIRS